MLAETFGQLTINVSLLQFLNGRKSISLLFGITKNVTVKLALFQSNLVIFKTRFIILNLENYFDIKKLISS